MAGPGRIEVEWQPLSGSSERGRDPEIRYVATATPAGGGARLSCTVEEPATTCTIQVRSLVAHFGDGAGRERRGCRPVLGGRRGGSAHRYAGVGILSGALALDDAALGALSAQVRRTWMATATLMCLAGAFNNWIAWYENGGDGTIAARRSIAATTFNGRVWSVHAAGPGRRRRPSTSSPHWRLTTRSRGTRTTARAALLPIRRSRPTRKVPAGGVCGGPGRRRRPRRVVGFLRRRHDRVVRERRCGRVYRQSGGSRPTPTAPNAVHAADLDGDGDPRCAVDVS